MRILLTGSRAWPDRRAVESVLSELLHLHGPFTLVHGACSTGADFFAHEWYEATGHEFGCGELKYKADWDKYGKAAGPIRNAAMVAAGADLVIAFPLPGGSGTQGTVEMARRAGIETREFKHE